MITQLRWELPPHSLFSINLQLICSNEDSIEDIKNSSEVLIETKLEFFHNGIHNLTEMWQVIEILENS